MNLYVIPRLTLLPLDRRRCPTRLKIRPIRPVVIVRCFLDPGLRNINRLVLIPSCLARATRAGASPKGRSGNPHGRPRGIPNPRRRVPDLVALPLSAQALSDLLDRKPHLLRPLAAQILPPPLIAIDPTERLGTDLSSLRTADDFRQVLPTVLAAVARGEIPPAEAARIAPRVRARLRALRRLARFVGRVTSAGAEANPS
jgi:hypothetical protein